MQVSGAISWPELIKYLSRVIEGAGDSNDIDQHKEAILHELSKYTSQRQDFHQFVAFDDKSFTKNLVAEFDDDIGNIIIMCWAPGQSSSIHSHHGSKCFVKILEGHLSELRMACPNDDNPIVDVEISQDRQTLLAKNDVTYIDDSIGTHRVVNESSKVPAISLHIYVPAYKRTRVFAPISVDDRLKRLSMGESRVVDLDFYNKN